MNQPPLSPEYRVVLDLLAQGCTSGDMAARLGLTERAVNLRIEGLARYLGVEAEQHQRVGVVLAAIRLGLVEVAG